MMVDVNICVQYMMYVYVYELIGGIPFSYTIHSIWNVIQMSTMMYCSVMRLE